MTDTQTIERAAADSVEVGPTIGRRRSLPGGRAVVGAFLVMLAAVGTFGAYLQATAAPTTSYLVATTALDVGQVLTEDDVAAQFAEVAVELPEEQAARTVRASQRGSLVGTVVVAPVAADDLVLVSSLEPVGTADAGVQLSVALPRDRAVGGSVAVGEVVDLIATFAGGQDDATTRIIARQVTIVAASGAGDDLDGGTVVLTVQVPDLGAAQTIQNAADVGELAILRGAGAAATLPEPMTGSAAGDSDDAAPAEPSDEPDEGADGSATAPADEQEPGGDR